MPADTSRAADPVVDLEVVIAKYGLPDRFPPAVESEARRLALIYARGVYGSDELPPAVNDVLRQIWETMESGTDRPVAVSNTL